MKVRFLSTKFYVSEKRRTVTCVMTAKLDDRKSGRTISDLHGKGKRDS